MIILPLLTHTYSKEVYAIWLQILLTKEILIPLLTLRLETALLRYLDGEEDKKEMIQAVLMITICTSAISIACFLLFPAFISNLLFGTEGFHSLLLLASLWVSVHACIHIGVTVLRSEERIGSLSFRELLSSLWLITSCLFAYFFEIDVDTLVLLCFIGDTMLLIWILTLIEVPFHLQSPLHAIRLVKKYFAYSMPLIFNSLFLWFTGSIDRFLIVHLISLSSMGIYGVSFQVSNVLSIVLGPINYVLFPRATASWNAGKRNEVGKYFSQAATLTLTLSSPIIVGLFVISKSAIPLLAGNDYTTMPILILALLGSVLFGMVFQNHLFVIHLMEKTYLLPILFIVTALVNYGLSYLLVSRNGIAGAGVARCMTFFLMAAVITLWARRYVQFRLPWATIFRVLGVSVLMGLSISWMPQETWLQIFAVIAAGVLVHFLLLILTRVLTVKKLLVLKREWR